MIIKILDTTPASIHNIKTMDNQYVDPILAGELQFCPEFFYLIDFSFDTQQPVLVSLILSDNAINIKHY